MKIVIIGTGNVATVLAKKLVQADHNILQVFGRNATHASTLATACGAAACTVWDQLTQEAELYIAAIADTALAGNGVQLQLKGQLLAHTAGTVSINVLKKNASRYGVLYPFQSIRKEIEPMPEIPFMVDANTPEAKDLLFTVARSISKKVIPASDETRMAYHMCAVTTNNFSNYLYVLAEAFCRKQQLDFSMLLPMIDETARRLHQFAPAQVQTGPAIRNDTGTIAKHLQLLNNEPTLQQFYRFFSEEILQHPW